MKKIAECRACGSKALTPALSFDSVGGRGEARYVICDASREAMACGLIQSAHMRAQEETRATPSSRYAATRAHLRAVATEALELISGRDCAALDIGCSDGALLSYYPRWVERFGVDPSEWVEIIGAWAWTARERFPSEALDRAFGEKKFDIVTAVSVLEEIEDPRAFFARVKGLLASDGVFALETLYLPAALTRNRVDAFMAGASGVYSLSVLERLARDSGLKIFRGALTDKEGGSIRLFLTHAECDAHDFDPWYERLARLWDEENALALRAMQPYHAFERRVAETRERFVRLLKDIADKGERAHLLGAGPVSAALRVWAGEAASVIEAAVEDGRSGERLGRRGPAIISETDCRAAEPDWLIAPASLKREMMERWREAILLGARMIVATPEPHVIHARNFAAEFGKTLAAGDGAGETETLRAILGAAGGPRLVAVAPPAQAASG
ncbi:class I SAM-dependent methyltransferase [Amphiplicatus metriothermophilus]|uniref:Methyltransferase domain-containing protein n=1 Tax=Amphiplicatus metriothermophilus TaxID=1519374 RepID=A0A239PVC8_9PROT|nr:class I SAM-dependent methyltransferase [Amphiplicatus metriothermophilus]MBB5519692.1 2-polyprenyl-3-methyl-5-hydroxy-6-metoxy-1,4-benzoquinol methylase [Amphiplicatus metriothermophilus]SNT74254.1 Methyltransferase domain-containing protein [Amphiplicatus metriothermophilus]